MRRVTGARRVAGGAAAIALMGALSGCGADAVDLQGPYTATEVRGHDLVEGSTITLTFADGSLSANAGCNTIFGGVSTDEGTLEFESQAASTLIACEEPLAAQDQWLTGFLTSSPALEVDGDTVELGDDSTGMTLAAGG